MEDVNLGGGSAASETPSIGSLMDSAFADESPDTSTEVEQPEVLETEADPEVEEQAPEEVPEEQQAEAEVPPVEAAPEVNEDFTVRDRNGKKELVFKESRGRMIYDTYKTAQAVEQVFGEPLTPELAQSRQSAFVDRESMIADFFQPGKEANVLGYLADIAQQGFDNGEITHDPIEALAAKFPDFVRGNPQAYQALASPIMRDAIEGLYETARQRVAADPKDDGLLESVRWVHKYLLNEEPRNRAQALKAPDAVDARAKSVEAREQALNQREQTERKQQFDQFISVTNGEMKSAFEEAVTAALTDVQEAYKAFPHEFAALKKDLMSQVRQSLNGNSAWKTTIQAAMRRAQNAVTPSIRDTVKADLVSKAKANAKYLLDPVRNQTVKEIIAARATRMKADSDTRHKRLEQSAAKREPNSPGGAVPQNANRIAPKGSGTGAFADFVNSAF